MKKVTIDHDEFYDVDDILGDGVKFYSFSSKYRNYIHPDKFMKEFKRELESGMAKVLGVYIHGDVCWALSGEEHKCPWDSVPVAGGVVVCGDWAGEPPDNDWFRGQIESYNDVLNGNVYCVSYGDESVGWIVGTKAVADTVNKLVGEDLSEVTFSGNAAWIMG